MQCFCCVVIRNTKRKYDRLRERFENVHYRKKFGAGIYPIRMNNLKTIDCVTAEANPCYHERVIGLIGRNYGWGEIRFYTFEIQVTNLKNYFRDFR